MERSQTNLRLCEASVAGASCKPVGSGGVVSELGIRYEAKQKRKISHDEREKYQLLICFVIDGSGDVQASSEDKTKENMI